MERPFMSTYAFMNQTMGARLEAEPEIVTCEHCGEEATLNCECKEASDA